MEPCSGGKHTLIEVCRADKGWATAVVRWCRYCGAIVVDREFDGRVEPGGIIKMQFPQSAKELYVCS